MNKVVCYAGGRGDGSSVLTVNVEIDKPSSRFKVCCHMTAGTVPDVSSLAGEPRHDGQSPQSCGSRFPTLGTGIIAKI